MKEKIKNKYKDSIRKIVNSYPQYTSDWIITEKKHGMEIKIPKISEDGFDIMVDFNEKGITVFSDYIAHRHFDIYSLEKNIEDAFGFIRDLLSPAMRLKVLKRNGKVTSASFQTKIGESWETDCSTGLLSFFFFLKKEEEFYINKRFPDRINI